MSEQDRILIDATTTHRERMAGALAHGQLDQRRKVNTNLRRFIGSIVLAAVIGVGCLGFSFVSNLLTERKEDQAVSSLRSALSANPIRPNATMTADPETGYLEDPESGDLIDPRTGYHINRRTGYATDNSGRTVDPRTGWYVDPKTGYFTDPSTGITIDPHTLQVVKEKP